MLGPSELNPGWFGEIRLFFENKQHHKARAQINSQKQVEMKPGNSFQQFVHCLYQEQATFNFFFLKENLPFRRHVLKSVSRGLGIES